jgi:hypothetical protein
MNPILNTGIMKRLILSTLFILAVSSFLKAQDTLPNFSVKNVGNDRIIIGWYNKFSNVTQISIQRSFDSLQGFKTLLTVTDPLSPQNGYVDMNPINDHMFYRLYIMHDNGHYLFSEAKKPIFDSLAAAANAKLNGTNGANGNKPLAIPGFTPSAYVYTNADGYLSVNLPEEEKPKKYSIKFFNDEGVFLFELKEVKERIFKVDKTNFYQAGWFRFELYEDGKLLEKHKFLLEKDF